MSLPRRPGALACSAVILLTGCSLIQPSSPPPSTLPSASPASTGVPSSLPRRETSEGEDTSKGHNDPEGLWAAVDLSPRQEWNPDPALLLARQRAWRRAVEYDFPPGGDITCDPRTFLPLRRTALINIGVTGPDPSLLKGPDPALLRTALSRAGERIMRVDQDGTELTQAQYDKLSETEQGDDEGYTPNDVSDPESYTGVVGISNIDTKGVRYVWLERTALRIVAEELRKAGAVPARIVPYLDVDTQRWLKDQGERLPTEDELR